jgi:hypothetical protein
VFTLGQVKALLCIRAFEERLWAVPEGWLFRRQHHL